MVITASGGTDGANIVLFWPNNLPDDADAQLRDDPIALVEQLRSEGRMIWFYCEGDGDYSATFFIGTSIPIDLFRFCAEDEQYSELTVNGDGYFGGMEYMFKQDHTAYERNPHMLEKVDIPEGKYRAIVYSTTVADSFRREWLLRRVGRKALRLSNLLQWLVVLSAFSVLLLIVTLFVIHQLIWIAFAAAVVFTAAAMLISTTKGIKATRDSMVECEREFPSYVVHLDLL
ncbi:hypothetical protein [Aeoliella mucimassa]|uniref:Uncharacterized protein n=1 Tax=Aeoliella mucimassa TaxID=2527972 RepID=A0A518AM00_9BACT|nr:hypothetical protein [Aeoliella mucimassa]QDU55747.1 hypothetical protein Pan181_19420 [Aeoliella mucimassa]